MFVVALYLVLTKDLISSFMILAWENRRGRSASNMMNIKTPITLATAVPMMLEFWLSTGGEYAVIGFLAKIMRRIKYKVTLIHYFYGTNWCYYHHNKVFFNCYHIHENKLVCYNHWKTGNMTCDIELNKGVVYDSLCSSTFCVLLMLALRVIIHYY